MDPMLPAPPPELRTLWKVYRAAPAGPGQVPQFATYGFTNGTDPVCVAGLPDRRQAARLAGLLLLDQTCAAVWVKEETVFP